MTDDRADEIMRHFDGVAESLRSDIHVLAEGHALLHDEIKTFRTEVAARFNEIHREIAEVKAAVTFSYAELDRRIRTLEEAVLSLGDRVDRLEARKS